MEQGNAHLKVESYVTRGRTLRDLQGCGEIHRCISEHFDSSNLSAFAYPPQALDTELLNRNISVRI